MEKHYNKEFGDKLIAIGLVVGLALGYLFGFITGWLVVDYMFKGL